MSDGSQSPFSRFGLKSKKQSAELDLLLNLSRSALLVIEARSQKIVQANQAALEITGYSASELTDLTLLEIIPEWNIRLPEDPGLRSSQQNDSGYEIRRKDFSSEFIRVKYWLPSSDGKLNYLVFDPILEKSELLPSLDSNQFWAGIGELLEAYKERTFQSRMDHILMVAQRLSGADTFAVYSMDPKQADPECIARRGDAEWLPQRLPAQELDLLKSGLIWQSRKHVSSILHALAQERHLPYIVTYPISFKNQVTGLLVFCSINRAPRENLLLIAKSIVAALNLLMLMENDESRLDSIIHKLEQSQNLLQIVQQNMILGCLVLSPDLKILEINHAAESILGYKQNLIHGQQVERILIGTETLQAALDELRAQAGRLNPLEVRLYRRSGEAFLSELRAYPVKIGAKLEYILVFITDLTEQEFIREHTSQLEQRAILGEVTAVFAHEVRNPINNISTGLELISLNLTPDDPNQSTISRLLQDCDRLAELMKSVLAFSRPAEYTLSQLSLESFFQNLLERMRPRMERAGVSSTLQVDSSIPFILGSPRALEQVFSNLINNAIQAMGDTGGQLVIKIQRAQESDLPSQRNHASYVEISVIDNGPGIPPELIDRIFQPFFTTGSTGTGLGLAISKRIITAHRGNITVSSFPGGTVFHVFLPAVNESPGKISE